ncbi:MAG: alkaline phosphatase [Sphingomonas sanxanigenens]|uniref:Alkaline phosphatase n=1 Tax=Sphingomonas sanxanigenens TaxID=397260 RepID=A0A2W5A3S7_9SPHN|nr:MAG: alkaline phosphatase [Sphingomonas sanxanigenens]
MTFHIDRRLLLKAGAFGIAAMATPGAAQLLAARGFTHGVASGEPGPHSVLLWVRYVGSGEAKLRCEVAETEAFTRIVSGGDVVASGEHDYCAKLVVSGLQPDRWYHYRFIAPDGEISDVGRTRTLPTGDVKRFGIGLFSCSNMPFGYFNAYAHAAERSDLDLMIHVGDYLYEYGPGTYPEKAVPGREVQPPNEMVTLADYRLRYAAYRADPDLRRLHRQFPMIAQWDDHEFANDSWKDGAENHDPAKEGPWSVRKAAAERVYDEWMPVSGQRWNSFQIGSLATIFRPETRITARTKQLDLAEALAGRGDLMQALVAFRDGPWQAADRTLMGAEQEAWLNDGLGKSVKAGTRWQVLAQEIVMAPVRFPDAALSWFPADGPAKARQVAMAGVAAAKIGLPFNFDSWDGYPAARARLLNAALESDSNLLVLSGDSHNAWGNNLSQGGRPAGVEFAGHSVTSPGFEAYVPKTAPTDVARALQTTNPDIIFSDTSRRGYVSLQLTADKVHGEWHFMDTILTRSTSGVTSKALDVRWGARRFANA